MSWMELSLDTIPEGVDWVCTLVAETITIEDIYITEYQEINQPELVAENATHPSWAFTIKLYLACDVHLRTRIDKIANLLFPLERTGLATAIQTNVVEEKLANANILNPVIHHIGKRFVVLAPNVPYESETADQVTLRLNKSFSFGSGFHPATILSLKLIERYIIPGMNTLDLGSGSGILSVAMAKLGATVLALDNDSVAVQATQDAVLCNSVEQQVTVMAGSLGSGSDLGHWMNQETIDHVSTIQPTKSFDLIVANILARVHVALADDFQCALRQTNADGGILIASGFTIDHEESVAIAFTQAGLELVEREQLNEWVAFAYRLV
ncbi:50S ribosomal protein L11 methyltransferase [Anabaena subtropica]|uniref:50S ribosomal protein L11 methyltransferase n=1 Tax=Anabaena subtropica FACHB-260 TaxID=2692884 RepID=A0ABR8CKZ9_9NOST|nr:50S ribosomal protein L11 methyltransferase [Anabaena subtropica]MBD2343436.1 50S ribosomal protein L11 methyltransferase [Anabaena subtropica FACHB-260]